MSDEPIRVLFLCTGNSARSQIAEALLQQKGKGRFVAGSAGTHPASEVHPAAIAALAHLGVDWSERRPKTVECVKDQPWDLIITVCDKAKETCPLFPGRPTFAHWGMPTLRQLRTSKNGRGHSPMRSGCCHGGST